MRPSVALLLPFFMEKMGVQRGQKINKSKKIAISQGLTILVDQMFEKPKLAETFEELINPKRTFSLDET